jgi:hypothetical protein
MISVLTELQQLGYAVQVEGDQLRLMWHGEGKPPRERVMPLVTALQRGKHEVLAALRNTDVSEDQTDRGPCGWCQSTMVWHADTGSGRIYCLACHAVFNPSEGRWAAGELAKRRLASDASADAA